MRNKVQLIAILAGLIFMPVMAAATGEGRQGPQKSGDAIPLQTSRRLSVEEVQNVTTDCYQKMLVETLFQIFADGPRPILEHAVVEFYRPITQERLETTRVERLSVQTFMQNLPGSEGFEIFNDGATIAFSYANARANWRLMVEENGTLSYIGLKDLPTLMYWTVLGERSFDRLGNVISEQRLVEDLTPLHWHRKGQKFKLIHVKTGNTIGELNIEKLEACLESGVLK